MLLDPIPQALLGDAENPRRADLHTTRSSERLENHLTLDVVERLVARSPGCRRRCCRRRCRELLDAGRLDGRGEVLGPDDPVGQQDRALEDVLQLADVSRPCVHPQALQRLVRERSGRPGEFALGVIEEGVDELGEIVEALTQRRQSELDSMQAIEQVRPESTPLDELTEGLVRRGDDPHVDVDRPVAAYALDPTFFDRAQNLRLHAEGHIADLVQEQGAATGQLEASDPRADGPGAGAALVAKQLGFEETLRDGGAGHRDQGAALARAPAMNRLRQELLARAALALDQHREVRRRPAPRHLQGANESLARADQLLEAGHSWRLERRDALLEPPALEGALDDDLDF